MSLSLLFYIFRRLVMAILLLIMVSIFIFVLIRVIPSKPEVLWAGWKASPETLAKVRKELGLDKPIFVQYFIYIKGVFKGNFGVSYQRKEPIMKELKKYFPATIELIVTGYIIAIIIGLPIGILSAIKKGKSIDHSVRVFALSGLAVPAFWGAMILQVIFYGELEILPLAGRADQIMVITYERITGLYLVDALLVGDFSFFWSALKHLILPAISLSFVLIGVITRMIRATMLEVLQKDYIRTARAQGMPESLVLFKYALKNSLPPTVTLLFMAVAASLVGVFLIELIFNWPGFGRYAAKAIMAQDYPVIMASMLIVSFVFVIGNLVADILVAILDPRIKYGE